MNSSARLQYTLITSRNSCGITTGQQPSTRQNNVVNPYNCSTSNNSNVPYIQKIPRGRPPSLSIRMSSISSGPSNHFFYLVIFSCSLLHFALIYLLLYDYKFKSKHSSRASVTIQPLTVDAVKQCSTCLLLLIPRILCHQIVLKFKKK